MREAAQSWRMADPASVSVIYNARGTLNCSSSTSSKGPHPVPMASQVIPIEQQPLVADDFERRRARGDR
jgi:hypothetical protein